MPLVNLKSTPLSNADASPVVPNYPHEMAGMLRSSVGAIVKGATDNNASTYRFVRLPSNARLVGRRLQNDAITGMTDVDFGLYAVNDGAEVDKDILEDGLNLSSAVDSGFAPFAQIAPENIGKRLWELAGETEDPGGEYDIVATANTSGSGGGDIGLEVLWTL